MFQQKRALQIYKQETTLLHAILATRLFIDFEKSVFSDTLI